MLKKIYRKLKSLFKGSVEEDSFFTKDYFRYENYSIGEYTYGKPKVLFKNENANLTIGKYCSIAADVKIFLGGNHRVDWITTYPFNALPKYFPEAKDITGHPSTKGDVVIGNDVWIGNGAVIGADSVVTKNIGPYEIWGGNPAKLLKKRFDEETIKKLEELKWWDWEEEIIRSKITTLQSNNTNEL